MKVIHQVDQYYPQIRQCYKCAKFNHVKARCKSRIDICILCGENKHVENEECEKKNNPFCYNCKGNYSAINRECPIRIREQTIRDTATKYNLSIAEVKKDISENKKRNLSHQNFPSISDNKITLNNQKASYAQKVSNTTPKEVTVKQSPMIRHNTQIPVINNKRDF